MLYAYSTVQLCEAITNKYLNTILYALVYVYNNIYEYPNCISEGF